MSPVAATALAAVLSVLIAYLLGSVSFAIIVTRLFIKKDIRDLGSGNAGMTNVLRTAGKIPALLVTVGDFCKGILAILISRLLFWLIAAGGVPFWLNYLIALFVMLGHCFPVFYGFKGGKGILVSAGVILTLNWKVFLVILLTFIVVVAIKRYVSLASISAAVMFPLATFVLGLITKADHIFLDTLSALVIGGIVVFMHRGNIRRLLSGTERKLGEKAAPAEEKPDTDTEGKV